MRVATPVTLFCCGPISPEITGIVLFPLLLAVLARRPVHGIVGQFLPVVIGTTATLTVERTANSLLWMKARTGKFLHAVGTCFVLHG